MKTPCTQLHTVTHRETPTTSVVFNCFTCLFCVLLVFWITTTTVNILWTYPFDHTYHETTVTQPLQTVNIRKPPCFVCLCLTFVVHFLFCWTQPTVTIPWQHREHTVTHRYNRETPWTMVLLVLHVFVTCYNQPTVKLPAVNTLWQHRYTPLQTVIIRELTVFMFVFISEQQKQLCYYRDTSFLLLVHMWLWSNRDNTMITPLHAVTNRDNPWAVCFTILFFSLLFCLCVFLFKTRL